MNPVGRMLTYQVPMLPDPACSAHQAAAGGDVRRAVARGCENLLRTVAHLPASSCSVELLFDFDPARATTGGKQARLKVYLRAWAADPAVARCLDKVIRAGLLSQFFPLEKVQKPLPGPAASAVSCRIVRRQEFVRPLHTPERNYRIPVWYYTISPFVPAEDNDYMVLDRLLDGLDEPVRVGIRVEPVDISAQLHAHTAYLARLQSINRGPDLEDDDRIRLDLTGGDGHPYFTRQNQVSPLSDKDPLANDIFQAEREIHRTLLLPHLGFCIRVSAPTEPVARLACSVLAEAGFEEGSYRIVREDKGRLPEEIAATAGRAAMSDPSPLPPTEDRAQYEDLRPLTHVATVEELGGIFRPPVASESSSPLCCRKDTDPPDVDAEDLIVLGHDAESSSNSGPPVPRGIPLDRLARHLATFGLPGQGKTTSNIHILIQLWTQGIAVLAFECAKRELRVLKTLRGHSRPEIRKLAEDLEVYTIGAEKVSPLRLNPLEVLQGISVAEHIEHLMYCIKASIPVSAGSLPMLLLEALEDLNEDYDGRTHPPVITDLIRALERVLARKEYSGETRSDMQTAIQTRLGTLGLGIIGKVFQCRRGMSIAHLLTVPCLLELDVLPADQMRLVVLFILVWIRLYLKTVPPCSGKLRLVILIEEAHVIFGTRSQGGASEEMADTNAALADAIARLLVELRALHVGLLLSDQHPSALDPAASKSVASMLAFRQTHGEDREELAENMLFQERQRQDIARSKSGEAFFFTEGYHGPRRIRTPNLGEQMRLSPAPSDAELLRCIRDQAWFKEAARQRISDELEQLKEAVDQLEDERRGVADQVRKLLEEHRQLLTQPRSQPRAQRLTEILRALCAARRKVALSQDAFRRGPYRRFRASLERLEGIEPPALRAFAESLYQRCQALRQSGTPGLLKVINKQIRNLEVSH